jgi:hypothetical protein
MKGHNPTGTVFLNDQRRCSRTAVSLRDGLLSAPNTDLWMSDEKIGS